jgi:transposase
MHPVLSSKALRPSERIRSDHIWRQIARDIDGGDLIYRELKSSLGANGNVSVAPPVILRMIPLLIFCNLRSERELPATIPERLDWL